MTQDSSTTAVAVFETRPYWGPELQRQFARSPVVIRECRSIDDLLPSINDFPSSLLVIDFDSAVEDCLKWFTALARNPSPCSPIIVCGSSSTKDFEWLLREAGVSEFLPDVISGDAFGRLCRWQLGLQRHGKSRRESPSK